MADGEYRGLVYRNNADLAAWLARRPPEKALEPDLPIIDAHHHLFTRPGLRYLLDEYLADARSGHKIVATVYMEIHAFARPDGPEHLRPLGEIEFANGVAAMCAGGGQGGVAPAVPREPPGVARLLGPIEVGR